MYLYHISVNVNFLECVSALDCGINGYCSRNHDGVEKCVCLSGFTGDKCNILPSGRSLK